VHRAPNQSKELRNEVTGLLDILKLVQEEGEQAPEVGLSGPCQNILENLRTLLLELLSRTDPKNAEGIKNGHGRFGRMRTKNLSRGSSVSKRR
jgi:hypothetical protein